MGFLIISFLCIILIALLFWVFSVNIKKLKEMAKIKEFDRIGDKYPSNIDICKEYLEMLNNKNVNIEQNDGSDATVYIAISNKILIGNLRNSYTRIQTIAHECLHSIQNKKLLIFNFIFSNISLLYFLIIMVLTIFGNLQNQMAYVATLAVIGVVYLTVRLYLESDAMIKARYLAKEYMNKKKISSEGEIQEMIKQYDVVTDLGVKCVYYQLALNVLSKIAILSLLCFWK